MIVSHSRQSFASLIFLEAQKARQAMFKQLMEKAKSVVGDRPPALLLSNNMLIAESVEKVPGVTPEDDGRLDLIVVPQSSFDNFRTDPAGLIRAVVHYVDYLMCDANFTRNEMPSEALQAAHCAYYASCVLEGGHDNFIAQSGSQRSRMVSDIMGGMAAIGAEGYHTIISDLAGWIAKNPRKADAIAANDEGGTPAELSTLDFAFLTLNVRQPHEVLLAGWIAGLEILQVVADDMIADIYAGIAIMQDKEPVLPVVTEIDRFEAMMRIPLNLGLGYAAGKAKDPLFVIAGGMRMMVKGAETTAWLIQTNAGEHWGVLDTQGAAIYAHIPGNDDDLPANPDDVTLDDMQNYQPPQVGALVSSVRHEDVSIAREICEDIQAAAAIDLLLNRLGRSVTVDCLSVHSAGPDLEATIYVVANDATEAFSAIINDEAAVLVSEPSHDVVATARRYEIDQHAAAFAQTAAA